MLKMEIELKKEVREGLVEGLKEFFWKERDLYVSEFISTDH